MARTDGSKVLETDKCTLAHCGEAWEGIGAWVPKETANAYLIPLDLRDLLVYLLRCGGIVALTAFGGRDGKGKATGKR